MKTAKKVLLLVLCAALLVGASVAGTLAYLSKTTDTITNTFTVGNISLTLEETKPTGNSAKLIPGTTIEKDPKVTVGLNSEACWLFVKIEEEAPTDVTFSEYIQYAVADGWTALEGQTGVYYREVGANAADQEFYVLKGDADHTSGVVSVPSAVDETDLNALGEDGLKLNFTAYAIQKENIDSAADAWSKLTTPTGN